jgi:transcriptional repressor NrdR
VNCSSCQAPATRVIESRAAEDGAAVRRRRRCSACGERFTTYERREPERLSVVKRDGRNQPFDRDKLRSGLLRASHKRDVDPRDLELIVDGIEARARRAGGRLSAEEIGRLCLDGLAPLDRGAYLQFAGTLPDLDANRGNHRGSGRVDSVREREDAGRPTERERARGEI